MPVMFLRYLEKFGKLTGFHGERILNILEYPEFSDIFSYSQIPEHSDFSDSIIESRTPLILNFPVTKCLRQPGLQSQA